MSTFFKNLDIFDKIRVIVVAVVNLKNYLDNSPLITEDDLTDWIQPDLNTSVLFTSLKSLIEFLNTNSNHPTKFKYDDCFKILYNAYIDYDTIREQGFKNFDENENKSVGYINLRKKLMLYLFYIDDRNIL